MATSSASNSGGVASNDVQGLNVAGIAKIKAAINTFVSGYSKKIEGIGINTKNIQVGIKGTASEKAISNLSVALKNSVTQSLNKLNTFANQLDQVKSAYSTADTSNTSAQAYANNLNNKLNSK